MNQTQDKIYHFFMDETGDHGLSFVDESFPIFLLAGCLFESDEADLCAYPIARHVLNSEEPYIPFKIIEGKIRKGSNGRIEGYGLKIFP